MISRFEFLGVFAAALLLLQTPMSVAAPATPPAADDAVAFISNLADDALNMLGAEDMSADQRLTTFEKLVRKDFDLRLIGRVALGRHWRRASKEQKSEYLDLFSTHVLRTYSSLLSSYSDEKIEIGGAKPAGDGPERRRMEVRERRMMSAMHRGFTVVTAWSPTSVSASASSRSAGQLTSGLMSRTFVPPR